MRPIQTALMLNLFSVTAWAQDAAPDVGTHAPPALSPFTDFTARVLSYGIVVGALVTLLLAGAFLVINLGLMSKRREDRTGGRNPSDVALLKENVWPREKGEDRVLPAMDEDDEGYDVEGYDLKTSNRRESRFRADEPTIGPEVGEQFEGPINSQGQPLYPSHGPSQDELTPDDPVQPDSAQRDRTKIA